MIAFFQTGGVGDAILGTAVIKALVRKYGEIAVLYLNHLVPQVLQGVDGISFIRHVPAEHCKSMEALAAFVPEAEMVVFNKFRKDHDGQINFFCPIFDKYNDEVVKYRETYLKNLNRETGKDRKSISDYESMWLLNYFNGESSYFADWSRYGLYVSYDDVNLDIYQTTIDRNPLVSSLCDYAIVHDSKFPTEDGESIYPMKAWKQDRWAELCDIFTGRGLKVVQIASKGQALFSPSVTPHYEIIGEDAIFQDYLYLLSRSKLYVGTDSWPGHAAVFVRDPKYILLKGSVSMRWDHGSRYSTIIRKGSCQACEGPPMSAKTCIWMAGKHSCMESITCEDIVASMKELGFDSQ